MKIKLALVLGMMMAGSSMLAYAEEAPNAATESKAATMQTVYVCPHCHTLAMKEGKCAGCGKTMVESHILAVKDGKATVCGCKGACKCDAKGMAEGKCGCGKKVIEVSLKGMYVCPAGCPMISDKPGTCKGCGKEMKKVE